MDVWREGLKNQRQVDTLLAFCRSAGVTDLFVHIHRDIGSVIKHDYLSHIMGQKGDIRIHGWFTLQVGRINSWTKLNYNFNHLMQVPSVHFGTTLMIDPVVPEGRKILVSRIEEVVNTFPDLAGIHLDKVKYPKKDIGLGSVGDKVQGLKNLLRDVRQVCGNVPVTIPIDSVPRDESICCWRDWLSMNLIDDVYPMYFQQKEKDFDDAIVNIPNGVTKVIFSCSFFNIEPTKIRLKKFLDRRLEVNFYSYGCPIFGASREQFKEVIRACY